MPISVHPLRTCRNRLMFSSFFFFSFFFNYLTSGISYASAFARFSVGCSYRALAHLFLRGQISRPCEPRTESCCNQFVNSRTHNSPDVFQENSIYKTDSRLYLAVTFLEFLFEQKERKKKKKNLFRGRMPSYLVSSPRDRAAVACRSRLHYWLYWFCLCVRAKSRLSSSLSVL